MKIATQQFDIPADLQPYLESIWYCAGEGPETEISPVQCCLPTGMTELIFHLTSPRHTVKWQGEWQVFPDAFVVGVQTEYVNWRMPGGTILWRVTVKPEMFLSLFGQPLGDIADDFAEANDFFGAKLNDFIAHLKDNPSPDAAYEKTLHFIRKQVSAARIARERDYFPEAMQYIRFATGAQSVDDVCGKVFVGKRQLQRAFQDFVCVSPKTYGRVVRFKSAYDFVRQFPNASWSDVTYNFGYSDQSHFIRDFKQFTGENPTSFMSGFMPKAKMPFAVSV